MTRRPLSLPPEVLSRAEAVALAAGFREVARLLPRAAAGLTPAEARPLVKFAAVLQLQAELRYPFWDDESPHHRPDDEALFQDVNMGLYEKLASALAASFPEQWAAVVRPAAG